MKNFTVSIYLGRFGNEKKIGTVDYNIVPNKGDFILYKDEFYKVLYCMLDMDNEEYNVFTKIATEEDF